MTTGWWSQYAANPTLEPYASYLNFVIPATRAVSTPTITPEGVVRRETPSEPGAGGGSASEGSSTSDTGGQPNVGQAAYGAAHSTALGGANTMGGVNLALTLAGIPSIATTLFAGTNMLTGALMGLNTDPESGLAVGGKAFAALAAGAPYGAFIDLAAPSLSPLASATIGPLGANQAGFSTSPMAVGTPFSSNPVQTARGETGATSDTEGGVTAGNISATAGISGISDAPGNTGVGESSGDAGGPGSAGEGMRRGGAVRDTQPGGGDIERRRLMAGEYVVRRSSAAKYRTLLDAINRGAHPNVVAHVASKLARTPARKLARRMTA
jgi:hypothetical protein